MQGNIYKIIIVKVKFILTFTINIPEDFDADEELRLALEEKYGSDD